MKSLFAISLVLILAGCTTTPDQISEHPNDSKGTDIAEGSSDETFDDIRNVNC